MTSEIEAANPSRSIRGKVAEVVSDRELILNKGAVDGVIEGDYFKVLNPNTMNVVDPETGEQLGGFNVIKIVVVAIQVADRVTLARTFRRKTVNIGGTASFGMASVIRGMQEPKYVEQIERLRLDEAAPRPLAPGDSIVSVGDPWELANPEEIEDVQTVTVWE